MRCSEIQDLISAYLDDELKPAQTARMEAHFRVCPRCSEELDLTRATVALCQGLEEVDVPSGFRAGLHGQLLEENRRRHPLGTLTGGASRFGSWVRNGWVATAAALVVTVALGVMFATGAPRKPSPPLVADADPVKIQSPTAPGQPDASLSPEPPDKKTPAVSQGQSGQGQSGQGKLGQSTLVPLNESFTQKDNAEVNPKGKDTPGTTDAVGSATGVTTPVESISGNVTTASALENKTKNSPLGAPAPENSGGATADQPRQAGPKIVKTGRLWFRVSDLEKAKGRVLQVVQASSGYTKSNNMVGSGPDRKIQALVLRVPAASFEKIMGELSRIDGFRNGTPRTDDKTAEYADLLKKIAAAREQEKVLEVSQSKATTDEESQKADAQLAQVRSDIQAMENKRLDLDLANVMPQITVFLEEVSPPGGAR